MTRPQDILLVLKIQALTDDHPGGYGGGIGSGAGYGDGSGFGGTFEESSHREIRLKSGLPIPFNALGSSIGISASQAFAAAKRAISAGLLGEDYSVRKVTLLEALLALKQFMPASRGGLVRGVPTSFAAPPLNTLMAPSSEPPPVWPYPEGSARGLMCEPIYKSAPTAALRDSRLYEYLALVDALRIGRAREVTLARSELRSRLNER